MEPAGVAAPATAQPPLSAPLRPPTWLLRRHGFRSGSTIARTRSCSWQRGSTESIKTPRATLVPVQAGAAQRLRCARNGPRGDHLSLGPRSVSVLLASYYDGHDDIITLPNQTSEYAYPFCREYQSLSLWEKLVAYPAYSQMRKGNAGDLFLKDNPDGDFAVEPVHYFASVQALFAIYGGNPAVGPARAAQVFQFLHVAYAGALDRPRCQSAAVDDLRAALDQQ